MLYENTVMRNPSTPAGESEFIHPPLSALKGRGSATRLAHRFEKDAREPFDDG